MNEMIERVARAISSHVPGCAGATCVFTPITECVCGRIARAAIAAMREPAAAMAEAGKLAAYAEGAHDCEVAMSDVWRAMIDAALEDG
jgi:hypothetical protein